jgi:predicted kinase
MVGLPCSGKTTLAQKLEHELPALRLTTDEWHIRLFGQDAEEPEHDARHSLIEAILWNIASAMSRKYDCIKIRLWHRRRYACRHADRGDL